jgi:bifunctional DNA-binding transcriptional regulator/antitoxin component of YhaV-PrlF toxin-antitoxin module
MYNEKVLGDSKMLKGGRVTIPKKVREKLIVKDGNFLTYLLTSNGFVKIKKLEFDWDKAIKQIEKFKREKLLKLTEPAKTCNNKVTGRSKQ